MPGILIDVSMTNAGRKVNFRFVSLSSKWLAMIDYVQTSRLQISNLFVSLSGSSDTLST
ncbi:hypothetical protein PALB_24920 [Pseudoalteromonas luteoviolacea B = ATCC 29581]|nr:hypothetical protein PALB_24920 [Pseudoalteromonas luteoviolacea B = ATCC 29581]